MTSASLRASASRSRSAAVGVSTTVTPAGAATVRFAASSVTSAPRLRASSASATPMRPDERLPTKRTESSGSRVPPAETSTRRPCSEPGGSSAPRLGDPRGDLLGLHHPHPDLALREVALRATARSRAHGGRRRSPGWPVLPHARVHRGRDEHRPRVRERGLGQDVVRQAVREARERVRGQRRDDEQVDRLEMRVGLVLLDRRASARKVSSVTNRAAWP